MIFQTRSRFLKNWDRKIKCFHVKQGIRRKRFFTLQKINIGVFRVKEIDEDDSIFQQLMEEYRLIGERLEKELLDVGKEKHYRDLIELIDRIADYIFKESPG